MDVIQAVLGARAAPLDTAGGAADAGAKVRAAGRGPTSARMPPCARPAPLRSAADPLLSGAPVPVGRGSASLERPSRPDRHASTARQPRSALHGVLPVWLHGRAAPISALQVLAQGSVDVHERLGAAGSRSAARHQRRSAPRCAFAGGSRPAGGPR